MQTKAPLLIPSANAETIILLHTDPDLMRKCTASHAAARIRENTDFTAVAHHGAVRSILHKYQPQLILMEVTGQDVVSATHHVSRWRAHNERLTAVCLSSCEIVLPHQNDRLIVYRDDWQLELPDAVNDFTIGVLRIEQ